METIFLAKVIGYYLVIMGLFALVKRNQLRAIVHALEHNPALMLLIAVMTFIIGLLMVVGHCIWTTPLAIMVSLVGWVVLLSGLFRLFFPHVSLTIAERTLDKPYLMIFSALISMLAGLGILFLAHETVLVSLFVIT